MNDQAFNPSNTLETSLGGPLCAGLYALIISVDASMIGPVAQTANYPAALLMHFDDIGLALQQLAAPVASYYADSSTNMTIGTTPLVPSEVQSIRFTAQLAEGSSGNNVTAYAYLEDIGTSTNASAPDECHLLVTSFCNPSWVELGQVTFTSSATISDNIPSGDGSRIHRPVQLCVRPGIARTHALHDVRPHLRGLGDRFSDPCSKRLGRGADLAGAPGLCDALQQRDGADTLCEPLRLRS